MGLKQIGAKRPYIDMFQRDKSKIIGILKTKGFRMKIRQIFDRKKAVGEMAELDPKVAAQVHSIKEHPDMLVASKKWVNLKSQLDDVRKELSKGYEGSPMATSIHSVQNDAEEILAGKSPAQLPGQSRDTERENLQRQRAALERAVEIARSAIQTLDGKLIRTECERLRPIALQYVQRTLESFELLRQNLEKQERFFNFLACKGFTEGLRPSGWASTGFEKNLLFGGLSVPCLAFFIEQRCKLWKLDGEKE